jgi:hypothetical protein
MSIRGNRLPSLLVVNYPTISQKDFEWIQNIRREHDRLNFNAIAPHFGIGNSLDRHSCKQLVDRLNADRLEIHGRVDRLDLIWSDRDIVRTIRSFNLS